MSTIQKNILEVKDLFLSENRFKWVSNFYNNINDYNKFLDKYIDLLNKAKSDPQMLIELYHNSNYPLFADMNEFLKAIKSTPEFGSAVLACKQVTTKLLEQYVQNYWDKNLEPTYNKIFDSFSLKKTLTIR